MQREHKNVIFTDHAMQRLKRRRISQDMAVNALRKPDRKQDEDDGKVRFVREINGRNVQIVARYLDDDQQWMVVTGWVRGEEDPRRWWVHVLLLPWVVLRMAWRVLRGVVGLARRR
jgi:hypothetical protein